MFNIAEIIAGYDFHMFIVERRDGSHFVGSLYKTENKARSVCATYIKENPLMFKHGYVFKIGVNPDEVKHVENVEWIEDEGKAEQVDDERRKVEAEQTYKDFMSSPGITNFFKGK